MQNFYQTQRALFASYGSNGIIWKNNVNARGSDGRLLPLDQKECIVCNKPIDDFEIALYGFLARGTQSANAAFCHAKCEIKLHIQPIDHNRTCCRLCESSKQLDGKFRLHHGRSIWYHQKCLNEAPRDEIVSVAEIEKSLKSRLTKRLKQAGMWFRRPEERLKILILHGPYWIPLVEALQSKSEEWLDIYKEASKKCPQIKVKR